MSDNESPDRPGRRFSRRAVILGAAVVVVIALVVVFLVHSSGARDGSGPSAAESAPGATINPTPKPSAAYTPAPTPTPTKSIRVVTPTGSASPGTEAESVPLTATAQPVSGVKVSLQALKAVQGKGDGVGEIDGPALQFVVAITNGTGSGIPLSSVVVNVTSGTAKTPADELTSARKAFPTALAKGATAKATYTFTLPVADRGDVQITVDYHVGIPITVFTGSAPR